jgi:hypothetical protein
VSKANIHPQHLRKSGGKVKQFGSTVKQTGLKLEETGQNLVSHASGDRSGVGSVVAKFTGKATEIAGNVFKEGGRVVEEAGTRLGKTADLYEEADTTAAKNLRKHHPDSKRKVDPPGGSKRSGLPVGKGGGSAKKPKRVPGGGTHPAEKVGSGSGGKDKKAPTIPGGNDEPARINGRLPGPDSAERRLPDLLDRHGMSEQEFNSIRHRVNQPGGTANISREEALKLRGLREDIGLEVGTPVQKVLSPWAAQHYLDNSTADGFKPKLSGGCFARMVDSEQINSPSGYYEGLRLDYSGTPFSPKDPSVHVLRTSVSDVNQYSIPFGGPTESGRAKIGGTVDWGDPFTGSGFTGSDRHLMPEWDRQPSPLRNGDEIHEVFADGTSRRVARYITRLGWVKEER